MARQEGPGVPAPSMHEPIGGFDVVSEDEWNAAREKLLAEEKALMKAKDRLVAKRRLLPATEIDRSYRFMGTNGDRDLLGLFEGRRQLVVYRFFYAPDVENWPDGACSGCSLFADTVVHPAHLAARDTTLAFVTAAPIDKIESCANGWDGTTSLSIRCPTSGSLGILVLKNYSASTSSSGAANVFSAPIF